MKTLPALFIFFFHSAAAQYNQLISKTPYNKFTEKPAVQWAVYAKDSVGFYNPNLAELLIKNFRSGKIKGFAPIEYGISEEYNIVYLSQPATDSLFLSYAVVNDTEGEGLGGSRTKAFENTIATDVTKYSEQLYQILYIEKGKLRSYISRLSLTNEIFTHSGVDLGRAEFLSFAVNKKYNNTGKKKNRIFLGSTQRTFVIDSFPRHDRIKEFLGKNMIETLWPFVLNGTLTAADPVTGNKIAPQSLNAAITEEKVTVAVYDSLGEFTGNRIIAPQTDPSAFQKVKIMQNWFYDTKQNIVVCEIPGLFLYTNKQTPVLKLQF